MSNRVTIYFQLLDEGTPVWRPAEARRDGDVYRLLKPSSGDDEERWEFRPGQLVRCERRLLSGTPVLVAVASVDVPR